MTVIDTVLFEKGTVMKRAGVRTPWTPALDPPLTMLHNLDRGFVYLAAVKV